MPTRQCTRPSSSDARGEWHEKRDASGQQYFKNTATGAVSYDMPSMYLPLTAQDSAFVRFLKFDLVGDRDIRGKKLAAALAAIGVLGLYVDYRNDDGLFGWYQRRTNPEAAAAAAEARRRPVVYEDDEYEYSVELIEVDVPKGTK